MRTIVPSTRRASWYDAPTVRREVITASNLRTVVAATVSDGKVRTRYGVVGPDGGRPLTLSDARAADRALSLLSAIDPSIETPELNEALGHLSAAVETARDRAAVAREGIEASLVASAA